MSIINILSPHVADLIAAGEVVERPASVVKELCENALDAGAKNVTVEIRGGGTALVRVRDDGCGMSPEDAGVAFLRHATSKLRDERDLEAIATMGFRGEALAAISAVSKIRLTTKQRGAESGTLVTLEAGEITDMQPFGCPDGTTMEVRDPRAAEILKVRPRRDRGLPGGGAALRAGAPGAQLPLYPRRRGAVLLPRRRTAGLLPLRAAGARGGGGHALLRRRARGRGRLGLCVLALGGTREPCDAVLLLQRPRDPLAAAAGRAGAGL